MTGAMTCPRCRGRLYFAIDRYGSYVACWNCGWVEEQHTGGELLDEQIAREGANQRRRAPSNGGIAL